MSDERRQHVADVMVHDQVGDVLELGRIAVDDDEARAVAFGHQRETGGRPDDQLGTNRDEKIARFCKLLRPTHGDVGHRLAE